MSMCQMGSERSQSWTMMMVTVMNLLPFGSRDGYLSTRCALGQPRCCRQLRPLLLRFLRARDVNIAISPSISDTARACTLRTELETDGDECDGVGFSVGGVNCRSWMTKRLSDLSVGDAQLRCWKRGSHRLLSSGLHKFCRASQQASPEIPVTALCLVFSAPIPIRIFSASARPLACA